MQTLNFYKDLITKRAKPHQKLDMMENKTSIENKVKGNDRSIWYQPEGCWYLRITPDHRTNNQ